MAARDRYNFEVTCERCDSRGRVFVSEEDHTYINSLDRRIDKIEGEFEELQIKDEDSQIICARCKQVVK